MYISAVVIFKLFSILVLTLSLAGVLFAQCPTIAVIGPAGVTQFGDEMKFRAEVNAVGPRLEYSWSVSAGTITEGQGTAAIAVATDRSMAGGNVTATVTVGGLPPGCEKTASEIAPIDAIPCGMPVDEWANLKPNDERSRLDSFFAELSNNPDNIGLVTLVLTSTELLGAENSRVRFVLRHAAFRKFEKGRIWFALESGEIKRTTLRRVPPGAETPCDKCLLIKGSDL